MITRFSKLLIFLFMVFPAGASAQGTTTVLLREPWGRAYLTETVNRIADAGFTHVMDCLRQDNPSDTPPVQAWLNALAYREMTPIVRLDLIRTDTQAASAWAAAQVAAWPEIRIWQIENEPDLWNPQWSGAQYTAFANAVTMAMRAADHPSAGAAPLIIWGGVTSDLGDFWPNTYQDAQGICQSSPDKMIGMASAILNSWPVFDGYAVHDYRTSTRNRPSVGCSDWSFFTTGSKQHDDVNSRLAADGFGKLVMSEQGFPLAWTVGTVAEKARQQAIAETRETVMAYWRREFRVNYTFVLASSNRAGDQEQTFGLVDTVVPWSQRPAYDSIQILNSLVPPKEAIPTGVAVEDVDAGEYSFYVWGHLVTVYWNRPMPSGLKRNMISGQTVTGSLAGEEPVWVWR